MKIPSEWITILYDLADYAYDAEEIKAASERQGHVPFIDPNLRRGRAVELSPAKKVHWWKQSTVERVNSDLKNNYATPHVRVKGYWEVFDLPDEQRNHDCFGTVLHAPAGKPHFRMTVLVEIGMRAILGALHGATLRRRILKVNNFCRFCKRICCNLLIAALIAIRSFPIFLLKSQEMEHIREAIIQEIAAATARSSRGTTREERAVKRKIEGWNIKQDFLSNTVPHECCIT